MPSGYPSLPHFSILLTFLLLRPNADFPPWHRWRQTRPHKSLLNRTIALHCTKCPFLPLDKESKGQTLHNRLEIQIFLRKIWILNGVKTIKLQIYSRVNYKCTNRKMKINLNPLFPALKFSPQPLYFALLELVTFPW